MTARTWTFGLVDKEEEPRSCVPLFFERPEVRTRREEVKKQGPVLALEGGK